MMVIPSINRSQMKKQFAILGNYQNNWATAELIKQYLRGHRKYDVRLAKRAAKRGKDSGTGQGNLDLSDGGAHGSQSDAEAPESDAVAPKSDAEAPESDTAPTSDADEPEGDVDQPEGDDSRIAGAAGDVDDGEEASEEDEDRVEDGGEDL